MEASQHRGEAARVDFFESLPPELALYLLTFLDHVNLCTVSAVNKLCNILANDEEVIPPWCSKSWLDLCFTVLCLERGE